MDYKKIDCEKMYEDIMNIDARIRLVTICDSNGRVVYSEHREGVKNLLTPEESKESLELAVNSWKTLYQTCTKNRKRKICIGRI